jgi:DNA-binding MarR family transcriptional regulator
VAAKREKAVETTGSASELRIVLGRLVRRLRAENTFPTSQVAVLARLDRDGPLTTSALAAAERVRPQSMAQTVAELQAAGFVARRPHPIDARGILIELSEHGLAALREDRQGREGWLAAAMAGLTDDERKALDRAVPILQRLAEETSPR